MTPVVYYKSNNGLTILLFLRNHQHTSPLEYNKPIALWEE